MSDVIQQHIDSIEQQVQIAEAGYQAFRRMFAQTNRPPQRQTYKSRLGILRIALIIIMVASSIVSASHTIPTFANSRGKEIYEIHFMIILVGVAAFFMSELALATFAYVGVMRYYRETQQEPKSLKRLVQWGVVVPFLVMAAANISHEFALNAQDLPEFINTGIILAISLSAPFMGYISGEVFAMFEVIDRVDQEKHDLAYTQQVETWEEKCRAAWGRSKGDYGGKIKIEPVPVPSIPFSNGNSNGMNGMESLENVQVLPSKSSIGHTKQPQATQIVKDYFVANPDALNGNALEIARELGVGKSTVYTIMKELRQ
jgi:hypothetical protein